MVGFQPLTLYSFHFKIDNYEESHNCCSIYPHFLRSQCDISKRFVLLVSRRKKNNRKKVVSGNNESANNEADKIQRQISYGLKRAKSIPTVLSHRMAMVGY